MKYLVIALCLLAGSAHADEYTPSDSFMIRGAGTESCATYLTSPVTIENGNSWALGYWTGMVSGQKSFQKIGEETDNAGILGEIQKFCKDHPSKTLAVATGAVWVDMFASEIRVNPPVKPQGTP